MLVPEEFLKLKKAEETEKINKNKATFCRDQPCH
jgi:hypothetical protein